jgi:hypothetical protein
MKSWIADILNLGFRPYVATSEIFLPHLDFSLFGGTEIIKLLEDPAQRDFHEAYLVSNSLGFGNPDLKMPNWVYIDCVLMQSAVVGFALPIDKAPRTLVDFYQNDPYVDIKNLDFIPVSGQIAALGIDARTLVGFSLFSLRRQIHNLQVPRLAHLTKYAALHTYKADQFDRFIGLSQYNNHALKTHALFGKKIYIEQPMMPLHPLEDMSFTYSMKVDFNEERILGPMIDTPQNYDFLMKADDKAIKLELARRMKQGERFYIEQPIHVIRDDEIYLPISIEK